MHYTLFRGSSHQFGSHRAFPRQIDPFMTYDPRWGRFKNIPTNLEGLSPTPMATFSLIPQSMRKHIAGQLWRSASILELPKMTPRWPLTPNFWTPLLPPPPNLMITVSKYYKNPWRHIREEASYDFRHTDRYTHAISSLNSLFPPFALPPKFWCWCHHCYYLLIYRKLYILQKDIYFSPPLHAPSNHMNLVFWTYLLCTTAFC